MSSEESLPASPTAILRSQAHVPFAFHRALALLMISQIQMVKIVHSPRLKILGLLFSGTIMLSFASSPSISDYNHLAYKTNHTNNGANCTGHFTEHLLAFATTTGDEVNLFESNGAGVAVGDLDDDGLLDIVFSNLGEPAAVFWNQGGLHFQKQPLEYENLRAVALVDVDADQRLDIVFTQRFGPPLYFRNMGNHEFERINLGNVYQPAYAMAWRDLDEDGDLDLVTTSYNAELAKERANDFLFNRTGGVFVYTNLGGAQFEATRLTQDVHGMAVLLNDLNRDRKPDIWIANDFDVPDYFWLNTTDGWQVSQPFSTISHSTMSLSQGDIDNDGNAEVFSSDMKPFDISVQTWVQWLPLIQTMRKIVPKGDPQLDENMLFKQNSMGQWRNIAPALGIDASGWSWSAQFGDLNQDGFLDLYIVNGMIDKDFFRHLPNYELVEPNQAFRNEQGQRFIQAPQWQLASTSSGRGMVMADLDNDGDLDIVINNLRAPAQIYENQLCSGTSLQVELRQPNNPNPFAVGATLALQTSQGTFYRDVHVTSGHLSADAPRVHFGFPAQTTLYQLVVNWPDGTQTLIKSPDTNKILEVTR